MRANNFLKFLFAKNEKIENFYAKCIKWVKSFMMCPPPRGYRNIYSPVLNKLN